MKEEDSKFDAELNFPKVIFLHINRVLTSTNDVALFIFNVESLEDVLYPYEDEEYNKITDRKAKKFGFFNVLDPMLGDRASLIEKKRLELARYKFRALMALAERKGLLLEEKAVGEDEDEQ